MMENGKRAQAAAVVAGGEVGGVPGGELAGALAGRRGPKVGRRREYGDPDQALAKDAALAAFAASKPGRMPSPEQVELEAALAENDRLSEALKELAVELTLHRGRQRSGFSARSPRA